MIQLHQSKRPPSNQDLQQVPGINVKDNEIISFCFKVLNLKKGNVKFDRGRNDDQQYT